MIPSGQTLQHQSSATPVLQLQGVEKSYQMDAVTVPVLRGIDIEAARSGSGLPFPLIGRSRKPQDRTRLVPTKAALIACGAAAEALGMAE